MRPREAIAFPDGPPPKAGQELARLIAGSRSATIPGCGHMIPAEAPDAMLDALIGFAAPAKAA